MTDLDTRHPEFAVAIRGYDRLQVDEYIERLQNLLVEAEDRARSAESDDSLGAHAEVSPRVAQIFELAGEEARELREKVEREGKELVTTARKEAKAIIAAAQETARGTKEQGLRDHDAMLQEFEQERAQITAHVRELEAQKASVLAELRRLYDSLGAASGLAAVAQDRPAQEQLAQEPPAQEQRALEAGVGETTTMVLPGAAAQAKPAQPAPKRAPQPARARERERVRKAS